MMSLEQKWREIEERMIALDLQTQSLNLMADIGVTVDRFVAEHEIDVPLEARKHYEKMESERLYLNRLNMKLKRIRQGVNEQKLGLKLRSDGDLDVLAPPEMNEDMIVYYSFAGGLLPIVLGTLIVGAITAVIIRLYIDNRALRGKYVRLKNEADKKLCRDPNSQICRDWQDTIKQKNLDGVQDDSDSLYNRASNAWRSIKSTAKTGATWGIAILIPLIALLAWSKFGSK